MKKAFTLVELLATILIISIITIIGVATYNKVREKIKNQEYENKISYIETKAALYASETGYLTTNVEQLVQKGYIEADNNKGEVISPKDKKLLNAHVIIITKEGDNYYGHFTEKEESNLDNLDMTNENLEIVVKTISEKEIGINEWSGENVILSTRIKKNVDTSTINKIIWYSNVGTKEVEVNNNYNSVNEYSIEVSQILNSGYRVELIFKDGTKYEARRIIKIDKQNPNIYAEDVRIENEADYTNENKKTRILSSDQNGSGISGYYIGTNENCTSNNYYASSEEKYEIELDNGHYYACSKDKVGNVSDTISFNVEKIDKESPTCEIIVDGTIGDNDWYVGDVTFKVEGTDSGSGVKDKEISSTSLKTDTKSYTVTAKVRDKAGNESICSVIVKRDTVAPECVWNGESTSWTNSDRTINLTCKDSTSECTLASKKSWEYKSGTHKTEYLSYTIQDEAGNTKYCEKNANVYVDKEAPSRPTSGNIGVVSGSNKAGSIKTAAGGSTDTGSGLKEYRYLITNTNSIPTDKSKFTTSITFERNCGTSYYAWAVAVDNVDNISAVSSLGNTSDGKNEYSAWGSCSNVCGGGTQKRTNSCALITNLLSQSCGGVTYKSTTTCSKSCGGGNYKREAYSTIDNTRCSSKDDYNGSSCNTRDCCSSIEVYDTKYGSWGSCSASCGGGTRSRTITKYYRSKYDGSYCGYKNETDSQSCNTDACYTPPESCTPTCNIRGTSLRTASKSWTCSHGHTQTKYYKIYCRDSNCNISASSSSPTRVCSINPYGPSQGWELYPD